MDCLVKSEDISIEKDIKQEFYIAETEWLPKKFEDEENEYYQEFAGDCKKSEQHGTVVKNECDYEQFTIEYVNESDDCEDDDYADSELDNTSMENDSCEEYNYLGKLETQEDEDNGGPSESKVLYELEFKKWIDTNFITRACPICDERFTNYNFWRRHILNHKEIIEESELNYVLNTESIGTCIICKQEFISKFTRYIHSTTHTEDACKKNILDTICKMCNFSSKRFFVRDHILEKHPEAVKDFKTSGSMNHLKCPLCSNTYIKNVQLSYHFMDKHPEEYKSKLKYNCHLCKQLSFSEEELFLRHLIDSHELNSWKILNFRKVFEDKENFACTKCHKLFFRNDISKLVRHFLNHDTKFRWSCKFCGKKFDFKNLHASHMCSKMVRYYERRNNKILAEKQKTERRITNLMEFEKNIAHVCPFCNKEFPKMLKWQQHLRTDHEIDSLKGMGMKVIANDISKLRCTFCHTLVANSPQQLHGHRFQHLPYQPYKCLLCSKTLNTVKVAINHVQQRCEDEHTIVLKNEPMYEVRSDVEAQCSYCNCQKIDDIKNVFKHYEDEHKLFEDFFIKHGDDNSVLTCIVCNKQCERNSSFEHLHYHFNEKAFKCKLCLRSYTTLNSIYSHFRYCHNVKPLNKQANIKKADKISLFLNKEDKIKNVTKLSKTSNQAHVFNEFAEFISYACPECNEGMTTQENWQTHIETKHNFFQKTNLILKEADGSLKCPTCNRSLNNEIQKQRYHKLTHMPHRSFICNLCYVRCNNLGQLYSHFRRKHFAQGTYKCPICPEVSQTEHGRTLHLKELHPQNEWPDSMCLICFKIFINKCNLNRHMATHESDRVRYTCDICGVNVALLSSLTTHMKKHKMRSENKEKVGNYINSQNSTAIELVPETDEKGKKNLQDL